MQTIQQERAKFALKHVQNAASNSAISQKEYKSYASALPAMIHINGLGPSGGFL
jgi:CRISPR-associated protein Cmr5